MRPLKKCVIVNEICHKFVVNSRGEVTKVVKTVPTPH